MSVLEGARWRRLSITPRPEGTTSKAIVISPKATSYIRSYIYSPKPFLDLPAQVDTRDEALNVRTPSYLNYTSYPNFCIKITFIVDSIRINSLMYSLYVFTRYCSSAVTRYLYLFRILCYNNIIINYNYIRKGQIQFFTRSYFFFLSLLIFWDILSFAYSPDSTQNKQTSRANQFSMAAVQSNNKDRRLYIVKAAHLIIFHK